MLWLVCYCSHYLPPGVIDTGGNLPQWGHWHQWQIFCRCRWHRGKFSTGTKNTSSIGGKFTACIVDNSGKFDTGVVDTRGNLLPVMLTPVVHPDLRISLQIFEKLAKRPYFYFQGLGGRWFMKKTWSKISWHQQFFPWWYLSECRDRP